MTRNALTQINFKLLDIIFFFTGGYFKVQFLGFGIQKQQRTGLRVHHPCGRFNNQLKQQIHILY